MQKERQGVVVETFWGYVLAAEGSPRPALVAMQVLSMVVAAALVGAGLAVSFLDPGPGSGLLRASLLALAVAIACPLVWFGTRGDAVELQIDLSLGEIREVVHNRAGRPSLVARHGFEMVDGLVIVGGRGGRGRLVLRFRDGRRPIELLRGDEDLLDAFGARLGRDLLHGSRRAAEFDAVVPLEHVDLRGSAA